ncbi:CinA family protein [Mucilaginibacter sp. SG564]|uniref:CinA family protein n=1 Tax=Mucilaginibacter sp. SG564 TaxID=2587022 RepID=UPI001C12AB88|nr:CinA family protein [Mucilaginibacter sp. SG564]NOW97183.1 nicotinamide-nucleotide amidase [Mucilaginibacter sp. SG564]
MMEDLETLLNDCCEQLAVRKLTISFAESATAGKLAYEFSKTAFSGQILKGGLVCYDACLKEDILGIEKELIETFTPESEEITREMALKLKKVIDTDVIVAVTGLTTEGGSERPGKPVGTMFYCVYFKGEIHDRKKIFTGSPEEIVNLTIEQVARTILSVINLNLH